MRRGEIAAALRRQAAALVEVGLAPDEAAVKEQADRFDALHRAPEERSRRWLLGVDGEVADEGNRRRELINFLAALPIIDQRQA